MVLFLIYSAAEVLLDFEAENSGEMSLACGGAIEVTSRPGSTT